MSKTSNYNLYRLFVKNDLDIKQFINQHLNSKLELGFKINKLFKFKLLNIKDKYLVTFNLSKVCRFEPLSLKTIQRYKLFRKKQTNTLYEINTIPKIIKILNNGFYERDYIINWDKFCDNIILSDKENPNNITINKISFDGYIYINNENNEVIR